jgi:hypothetical protein
LKKPDCSRCYYTSLTHSSNEGTGIGQIIDCEVLHNHHNTLVWFVLIKSILGTRFARPQNTKKDPLRLLAQPVLVFPNQRDAEGGFL